ncbi:MAG: tetratricopeptide repeat protein [Betaproteobacteria bacterium]|nr:MAG: tetratricopeptide repeat protein [Betaproteobacteria bacterium]TMH93216.1 MAG: tetratricopeptide repeat protein [Betaproteobacteria bacterium]
MSLLLEALKKAELAKQVAKAEAPAPEPKSEPAPGVITREKLPDISQPLEILTDDLPSSETKAAETAAARPELSLEEQHRFEPAAQPMPAMNEFARTSERAQAQQLFQVKEMDYNPRRPFYLTLGALAVVGVCYVGYVWWQMRPKYAVPPAELQARPVAAPAPPAVASAPVATPSQPDAAPPPPAPQAAVPAPARTAVPTIPPIQPVRPPRPRSQPASGTLASSAVRPESASESTVSASPRAGEVLAPIAINAPTLGVDPLVEQGYQAFQRNDLVAARDAYQRALAREPTNRDALLGLAAIDVRSGQLNSAEARYLKLLEMDPRDSHAAASLISLRGQLDPVASESRLKNLIATQPESALLHFSLGNQYAQQARWSEAQAAYFKAHSVDPENADYVFNLAVSLDQLHQGKLALEFYQRALALTDRRAASFDPARARLRVQELSK